MNNKKIEISILNVNNLIKEQFQEYSHLEIKPVETSGWDNKTFKLGESISIRLPSAECYINQVNKEQKWLPILKQHLSIPISEPIKMGLPSSDYPWNWSIYKWINGKSANIYNFNENCLNKIALELANFLNELHTIDISLDLNNELTAGDHNFHRGGSLEFYNNEFINNITNLKNNNFDIDYEKINIIWQKAISSKWNNKSVFIHGDLSSGNIIIENNNLKGIIDFGQLGIGDPACDLVISWTFLDNESRKIFKLNLNNIDADTWIRAYGWCIWKSIITINSIDDKNSIKVIEQKNIIDNILKEFSI